MCLAREKTDRRDDSCQWESRPPASCSASSNPISGSYSSRFKSSGNAAILRPVVRCSRGGGRRRVDRRLRQIVSAARGARACVWVFVNRVLHDVVSSCVDTAFSVHVGAAHSARRRRAVLMFFGNLRDGGFSREQERRDRRGVLQARPNHFCRPCSTRPARRAERAQRLRDRLKRLKRAEDDVTTTPDDPLKTRTLKSVARLLMPRRDCVYDADARLTSRT